VRSVGLAMIPSLLRKEIYSKRANAMTDFDDTEPDEPPTPEEEAQVRLLTAADLKRIDECLLSNTSRQFIGQTMLVLGREHPTIPDAIYRLRIKHLAESGALEAAGNLDRMRHSEIRLRDEKPVGSH
jgi:hypothetical protein